MRLLTRFYAPYLTVLLLGAAAGARFCPPPWCETALALLTGWLWCATAVVCCFVWSVLGERTDADGLPQFMLYFGVLTVAVLLDDAFRLREFLGARLGIGGRAVYAGYAGLLILGARIHRHEIRKSELRLLGSAILFLGLSLAIGAFPGGGPWRALLEGGLKLLGAAGWLGYFTTTGSRALRLPYAVAPGAARPAYAETGSSRMGRSTASLTEAQQRSQ